MLIITIRFTPQGQLLRDIFGMASTVFTSYLYCLRRISQCDQTSCQTEQNKLDFMNIPAIFEKYPTIINYIF